MGRVLLLRLLRLRSVRVREIRNIVRSREFGGPDRVQELYTWQRERFMGLAKGVATTVVSVLTAILVAFLKGEIDVDLDVWHVWLLAIGTILSGSYAGYLSWRLARIPAEYSSSLRLYRSLARGDPTFPPGPWK